MNGKLKTIAYIGKTPDETSMVGSSLKKLQGVDFKQHSGTLAEVNGQAVNLTKGSDLVVFETGPSIEEDARAIEALRADLPESVSLIAVASASASLADVRRLTGAGVDDVIPDSIDALELEEQVRGLVRKRKAEVAAASGLSTEGKVIAVTRSRGGIGGTTVAVNVADALLDRQGTFKKKVKNRVAIVDFDLQFGTVASHLDCDSSEAFYQMLLDGTEPDSTFIEGILSPHKSGLSVLAAPSSFVPLTAFTATQAARIIDVLKATHDFVVIDLPHALVDWLSAVLERSDKLLLVTDSSVPSIHQSKRLIDFFTSENLSLDVQVVINHEKKPVLPKRHHQEAAKVLDREFRYWLPFDPKSARDASDRGVPINEAAGSSALAKSLGRLGRAITTETSQSTSGQSGKRS